jgi:hypothetical protein
MGGGKKKKKGMQNLSDEVDIDLLEARGNRGVFLQRVDDGNASPLPLLLLSALLASKLLQDL